MKRTTEVNYSNSAMDWTTEEPGFYFRQGVGNDSLLHSVQNSLGPTQPLVRWVPVDVSSGVKWPGREANHFHLVPRSRMRYQVVTPLPIFPYGMLLQGKLYLGLMVGGAKTNPDSFHNLRKIKKNQEEGHEE